MEPCLEVLYSLQGEPEPWPPRALTLAGLFRITLLPDRRYSLRVVERVSISLEGIKYHGTRHSTLNQRG